MLSHVPVMLDQVLGLLDPQPGETYLDCTAGLGGHAAAIAERVGPTGTVILNDLDQGNLDRAAERVRAVDVGVGGPTVHAWQGGFAEAPGRAAREGIRVDMVLADLGFASTQIDDPERGLSFRADGPLDMRFDLSGPVTAADLVNEADEDELARILREYGEEKMARRIARKLVESRESGPIRTTSRLAEVVRGAAGSRRGRIDPATKSFQALRIAVNDELGQLDALLKAIRRGADGAGWLAPHARVAILAFHSLEDRSVKQAFAELDGQGLARRLTRKPITGSDAEIEKNRRARSARLRAIRLTGGGSGSD